MTIRHIRIFVSVCECGCNTTRAAEKLHMTQPAVSLAIRELEDYYGVRLFDRINRRLSLSEAGRKFHEYAKNILLSFDDMERSVQSWNDHGRLCVGASISIGAQLMPKYVRRFSEENPDTEVRVLIDRSDRLERALEENTLDFAMIEGILHSPNLVGEDYLEDRLAVVGAGEDFSRPLTPEEFLSRHLLLREHGSGTREVFDSTLQSLGYLPPQPSWESLSTAALVNAAKEGLGLAVVPRRMVVQAIDDGSVCEVRVTGIEFHRKYKIVYHKNKYLTPAAARFIEICKSIAVT